MRRAATTMHRLFVAGAAGLCVIATAAADAAEPGALEPVRISADGTHFVLEGSGRTFTPWGFNYLGEFGTVLEEYWAEKWSLIDEDFREMKTLGANVIRVHLQLGTYMSEPDAMRTDELARLRKLLDLAQVHGLRVDVTGLGCYHLKKIPAWLDALSEAERWQVQVRFWRAVAETCRSHAAVFCYDLMNEPVITEAKEGEHPWLTGELDGFYFVQRICNRPGKRTQQEIAAAWVKMMAAAIRSADPDHLITVGVIPWAMVWPGAKPVFYAPEAAKHLDFVAVHFYPQAGKVKEAIAALKVYAVGKPVVVEETFPLSCSLPELEAFMNGADGIAQGWISHYFGTSITDYRKQTDVKSAAIAEFLEFWQRKAPR